MNQLLMKGNAVLTEEIDLHIQTFADTGKCEKEKQITVDKFSICKLS